MNYESKIKKLFKFEYHVHVIHVLPSIILYGYVYISAPPWCWKMGREPRQADSSVGWNQRWASVLPRQWFLNSTSSGAILSGNQFIEIAFHSTFNKCMPESSCVCVIKRLINWLYTCTLPFYRFILVAVNLTVIFCSIT